jgi:calcineurin-like phosphoesterase family protein
MKYFTADEHYFHNNITKLNFGCNREKYFANEKDMRRQLIENHNSVVRTGDEVFHIGDFAMIGPSQAEKLHGILRNLNGVHHLILGNHDEIKPFSYVNAGFTTVHTAYWFEDDGIQFVLNHDPAVTCLVKDKVLLCGHVHILFDHITKSADDHDIHVINVGVDVREYMPVSMQEIHEML